MKKKEVPKFRYEALEEKFIGHMTRVCEIFNAYGELKESFNIKQMLAVLKTENWELNPALNFYMTPLKNSVKDCRDWMLKMESDGPLRIKYIVENNKELQDKTIFMLKQDFNA
jgi:hypothetical protein